MVSCQCLRVAGRVYDCLLLAMDKDPHFLCSNYRGKECNMEDRCSGCHNWTDEMWTKVSECRS